MDKFGKRQLVVRSNQLVEARTKLSIAEQRVILYLLSKIEPQDEDFKIYSLSLSDFAKFVGKTKSTVYEAAKEVTRELMRRVMTIREPDGLLQIAWLSLAKYKENEGVVELRFDPALKPYLLGLKSCFTQYELGEVIKFSNQYSWRIYELCKQYLSIGERTITIDQLRYYLDLEKDKYSVYNNFKRRVIEPTVAEINSKTSLSITYEEIKAGRKVSSIRFVVKHQARPMTPEEDQIDLFEGQYIDAPQDTEEKKDIATSDLRDRLTKFGLKPKRIASILQQHDSEYISANLDIVEQCYKAGVVKNLPAFTQAALEEDYRKTITGLEQQSREDYEKLRAIAEAEIAATAAENSEPVDPDSLTPEFRALLERLKNRNSSLGR